MEIIEVDGFTVNDIPVGAEMFIWSQINHYNTKYGINPTLVIKSGDTYFMPTPRCQMPLEKLKRLVGQKKGVII